MSDKKEKDSKVKSSKAKKNVEKTQEVSVSAEKKIFPHSCTDCGVLNCSKRNASYPEFCLTEKLTEKELEKVVKLYTENEENNKIAIASAEVEGGFYGKYSSEKDRCKEDRHRNLRRPDRREPYFRKDIEIKWV